MNEIAKILNFYLITTTLKDKVRQGPVLWHVSKSRLESVAEHVYGVCMLAIAIDSEFDFGIDIKKVIIMLAIHELEECYIGDLTPFDHVTKEEKRRIGEAAVQMILKDLIKGIEYMDLTIEYNSNVTAEANFAHFCDTLEMMLQTKIDEEKGFYDMMSEQNKGLVSEGWIQNLINNGAKTVADLYFDYHMPSFRGNEVFESLATYAKTNQIVPNDLDTPGIKK